MSMGWTGVARNARILFGLLMFASEWVSEHISTQPERSVFLKANFSLTSNKSPRIWPRLEATLQWLIYQQFCGFSMSALGQKQTLPDARAMSASPPTATLIANLECPLSARSDIQPAGTICKGRRDERMCAKG